MNPSFLKPKRYKLKASSGFTLIELLVVIAIIGLLSTIVVASLSNLRKNARNAKRLADIKTLITTFNLGLSTNSTLPSSASGLNGWACISVSCYSGWNSYTAVTAVDNFLAPYLPAKPDDPYEAGRGKGGYMYNNSWSGISPYDGGSLPIGAYLNYTVEPPLNSTSCSLGKIWDVTSNYVQCLVKID